MGGGQQQQSSGSSGGSALGNIMQAFSASNQQNQIQSPPLQASQIQTGGQQPFTPLTAASQQPDIGAILAQYFQRQGGGGGSGYPFSGMGY